MRGIQRKRLDFKRHGVAHPLHRLLVNHCKRGAQAFVPLDDCFESSLQHRFIDTSGQGDNLRDIVDCGLEVQLLEGEQSFLGGGEKIIILFFQ